MAYKHNKSKVEQVEFARHASYVKRMHVHRIVGDYTSHEHVNNMQNMYLLLCPSPTLNGVKAIQWHDAGEPGPGDVPSPAKAFFGLGQAINNIERCVRENFGLEVEGLTSYDSWWLKALDLLEFYLFCQDQLNLGNNFIMHKAVKVRDFIDKIVVNNGWPNELTEYYLEIRESRPFVNDDQVLEMRE